MDPNKDNETEEPMEQDEEEDGWSDIGSNDDDQDQEEPSPSTNSTTVVLPKTLPGQAKTAHQANKAKIRRQKFSMSKRRFQKRKRRRPDKPRLSTSSITAPPTSSQTHSPSTGNVGVLPAELEAVTSGLDASLTRTARKLGLNRRQVKSVLKSVCSDAAFLGMMREKAGEAVLDPGVRLESRVTRTKAKNLKEDGAKLDWVLEKMEELSKQTPKKDRIEEIPLGTVEFPEEDEPDDVEYDPKNDPEALEEDDDESIAASSDVGTPNRSLSGHTSLLSPPSSSMSSFPSQSNTPGGTLATPKPMDPTSTFKLPTNSLISNEESENEPPKKKKSNNPAARNLLFNDLDMAKPNRTWLTRSKANLKHVPIEELETQFVPPDITPDMYDTHVDDYTLFLAETFYKPITPEPVKNPEIAGGHTFDLEETDPDPDYKFQESEEHKSEERDEFKYDRSTKISKKEVDSLIHELITAYDLDKNEGTEEAKSRKKKQRLQEEHHEQLMDSYYAEMGPDPNQVDLTAKEVHILSHQIKMHIQLLTQMTILTSHEPKLHRLNFDCKQMTTDLVQAGMNNPKSILNAPSLFPCLNLVDQWEQLRTFPFDAESFKKKKYPLELNSRLMNLMGESGVFQYPSLIPSQAISIISNKKVNTFSDSEDYLIAMGLEEYNETMKKKNKKISLKNACAEVVKKYCPGKTVKQVLAHIHNARRKSTCNKILPHLLASGQALVPEMDYDQLAALPLGVPLRQAPPLMLPEVWRQFFCLSLPEEVKPPPPPKKEVLPAIDGIVHAIFDPQSQTIAVQIPEHASTEVVSTFHIPDNLAEGNQKLYPKKYRPILPKTSASNLGLKSLQTSQSPLKKERERILRKYSPLKKARGIRPKSGAANKTKEPEKVAAAQPATDISEIVELPKENIAPQEEEEEGEPLAETLTLDSLPETSAEPVERVEQTEQTKRKTKQQREAEIMAYVMAEETVEEVNARREREAFDIFKFAERDLDPLKFTEFLGLLTTLEQDVLKGFTDLHQFLKGHVEIQEMLLDLLTPESAIKLGQPVYTSFLARNRHKEFFRKLRRAYEHTPSSHTRILKDLANCLSDPQMDQTTLTNMASKLFRGNPLLHDLFLSLLPNSPVLDSRLPNPEVINLVDLENDLDGDESMSQVPDGAEKVSLLGDFAKDEYGGDKCPCACHAFSAEDDRSAHCLHCSIRINGLR